VFLSKWDLYDTNAKEDFSCYFAFNCNFLNISSD